MDKQYFISEWLNNAHNCSALLALNNVRQRHSVPFVVRAHIRPKQLLPSSIQSTVITIAVQYDKKKDSLESLHAMRYFH